MSARDAPLVGEPITCAWMDGTVNETSVGTRVWGEHPVARDGALTLFPEDEGITWARGWGTPEADALRVAYALADGDLRLKPGWSASTYAVKLVIP